MKSALGCLLWAGAIIVGVGAILKVTMFDIATVEHNAMAPTITQGERVVIFKRGKPALGKIAVCEHPEQDGLVVGRVVARDGMTIDSVGQELRIDQEPVRFNKRGVTKFYDVGRDTSEKLIWGLEHLVTGDPHRVFLPENKGQRVGRTKTKNGELYLLGDNRAYYGHDSRGFGVLDETTCRGTVSVRITPSDQLTGPLEHGYFDILR